MYLTIDEILSAHDLPAKDIEVPEWGGVVRIEGLTKAKQVKIREATLDGEGYTDTEKLHEQLWINCVIEPQITLEQLNELRNKSAVVFDRISLEIMKLNGDSKEVAEDSAATFPEGSEVPTDYAKTDAPNRVVPNG